MTTHQLVCKFNIYVQIIILVFVPGLSLLVIELLLLTEGLEKKYLAYM